jgi:hypothetical protein
VRRGGAVVAEPRKGAMAGTPLAPLLTNVYLRDLDDSMSELGVASARYSDDILVLGAPEQVEAAEALVRDLLAQRGLRLNEAKTRRGGAGEPWDFLGLRHDAGRIGLSDNTVRRLRAKVRRRARALARYREASHVEAVRICQLFVASLNRKLYGVRSLGDVEFSWARWFFPLLTTSAQLAELDGHIQRDIRWAATGSWRDRARSLLPYEALRGAGYVPLMTAYQAHRQGVDRFAGLIEARCAGNGHMQVTPSL